MEKIKYTITIVQGEKLGVDTGWISELPGICATGQSPHEIKEKLRVLFELHLEDCRKALISADFDIHQIQDIYGKG